LIKGALDLLYLIVNKACSQIHDGFLYTLKELAEILEYRNIDLDPAVEATRLPGNAEERSGQVFKDLVIEIRRYQG
jgi:hypothetical protein